MFRTRHISNNSYNTLERAIDYNAKQGFDPKRKEEMLQVTLDLILQLMPKGSSILELGAGSGLFTIKMINTEYFNEIVVTDGAEAMLEIANKNLVSNLTNLTFNTLDFTQTNWSTIYNKKKFEAVTSSMALHHAEDKKTLFKEVYNVLSSDGIFVFADHVAGDSALMDKLIAKKRANIKLGIQAIDLNNAQRVDEFIRRDKEKQDAEGNKCESVSKYLKYLQG